MIKNIKLPAPQLSELKEVDIDLDMTGRHYAALADSEGKIPEDLALSILKDLIIDKDANKLTLSELRYLFMLVKINAMDNEYVVPVLCTHKKKDGKLCHHKNEFVVRLSDADLNRTPEDYKVPEIEFVYEKTQLKYKVMPPTMDMESALLNWITVEKGISIDDLENDKQSAFMYTFIRSVMHLVNEKGERLINHPNQFENCEKLLDINKYKTIQKLYMFCEEVDSYGVQADHKYIFECKECGGELYFTLPLLHGLVD